MKNIRSAITLGLGLLTSLISLTSPLTQVYGQACPPVQEPQTLVEIQEQAKLILNGMMKGEVEIESGNLKRLQVLLKLDSANMAYYLGLLERKRNPSKGDALTIFEPGKELELGKSVAYPTAIAPDELLKELTAVDYRKDILKNEQEYREAAKQTVMWYRPMQAGTGSSVTRKKYLSQMLGITEDQVKMGAKGTDLYLEIDHPLKQEKVKISLAEAQILRIILDAQKGDFQQIVFHDIVSSETDESIKKIWQRPSLLNPDKTYEELVKDMSSVQHFAHPSYQVHIPTLTKENEISFNRRAPGGHGLFGVDALVAALHEETRPQTERPLFGVIGNGEDLSAIPDSPMIGWMAQNKVPIVMVTTEKTKIDLKGGQIALIQSQVSQKSGDSGKPFIYTGIIEKAQADELKQTKLFEQLGLRPQDKMAFFNTNMAIFNYEVLIPKLKKLVAEIGEENFYKVIAPNLIENWKEQVDSDGVKRKYLQLEGAMGSVILNLDRTYRSKYGEALVSIINVDKELRTNFFSPLKTAFDYFMQFHSDRFSVNSKTLRLENHRPAELPAVSFTQAYYNDVTNVLNAFQGSKILHLDFLSIDGLVKLPGMTLKGKVVITSKGREVIDLSLNEKLWQMIELSQGEKQAKGKVLENVEIVFDESGEITSMRPIQ